MAESRISGAFTGWSGHTVFNLENGQYWKQASYAYRYHYAYRPVVSVNCMGGRYYLTVDGVGEQVEVVPASVKHGPY